MSHRHSSLKKSKIASEQITQQLLYLCLKSMKPYSYSFFKSAAITSLLLGTIIIIASCALGKQAFFLLLNKDLGSVADFIFTYLTYMGDGILWIPAALYFIFCNKKKIPIIIGTILISTSLVQVCKQLILPGIARPFAAIINIQLIHTVKNVAVHTSNSFPSGHTTTVFCFFLLGSLVFKKWTHCILAGIVALLTAYSRIYLAQHFPIDIGAGIITAVVSVYLALLIQLKLEKQWFTKE